MHLPCAFKVLAKNVHTMHYFHSGQNATQRERIVLYNYANCLGTTNDQC
jgi:hypothetical protein